MDEVLELEIRRKIYNLIAKNPGLHARKIAELISLSGQLTDYHLLYLERNKLITSVKEEGYRRYYVEGKLGLRDRRRIAVLRQETPLKIVLFLLRNPNSQHKDILAYFDIAKSTISYHLQKLVKNEIIVVQGSGKDKRYHVINEKEIIALLIRYKPYSRIESFRELWADLKWPGTP
jgi:predicted transcriptional regulator